MSGIVKGIVGVFAKQYQGIVAGRCAAVGKYLFFLKFSSNFSLHIPSIISNTQTSLITTLCTPFEYTGLKYEDLLLENDDMEKALNRIPKSVKIQR